MTKEEETFHNIGSDLQETEKGQLFGKPCYKVGGKAFTCCFQNQMVFKLKGEIHSEALSLDGAQLFDPSGKNRPMKEWVQVPFDYSEDWQKFAKAAFEYVKVK